MMQLVHVNCGDAHLLQCAAPPDLAIRVGDDCVVELDRVPEFGRVVRLAETETAARPKVLRRATLQDQSQASENLLFEKSALRLCQEKILQHQLAMRLLRVRYAFDRSRLTVVYAADERVDFRRLVAELAAETRARVEMRQIGARTRAGLLGGLAVCGRRLCCASWLDDFGEINVRMAKAQGLPLNPVVLNGMCGRLKCCLRFEDNCYRDLGRELPPAGAAVDCPAGRGRVLETRVLAGRVRVGLDDQRVLEFDRREVILLGKPPAAGDNDAP